MDLLAWLDPTQVNYPPIFDDLRNGSLNERVRGNDVTYLFNRLEDRALAQCLVEIIKVGTVDAISVGCVASKAVLYLSLVIIVGIVVIRFLMALWYHWVLGWRIGAYDIPSMKDRNRQNDIEEWSNDIYRQAPNLPAAREYQPQRPRNSFFSSTSRFTPKPNQLDAGWPPSTLRPGDRGSRYHLGQHWRGSTSSLLGTPSIYRESRRTQSTNFEEQPRLSGKEDFEAGPSGFIHENVVPQPPPEYKPFGFDLAHVLCLVTTYNESMFNLRTTFDSIVTSEYPNSHKVLFVICDGVIKGAGEARPTPDYILSMMKDLAVPADKIEAFSYMAIATGEKRHNMAQVYAGFYDYDDETVPVDKQQRVPMICIVKCGTPQEAKEKKPGNRGKRDSHIILMSFLQRVFFDERMTELDFEIFNGIWKITGLFPDVFDSVLMVASVSE